jgi:hypothetical protein
VESGSYGHACDLDVRGGFEETPLFYGILVMMFFEDNKRHRRPHVHVEYQDHEAVLSVPDGKMLRGSSPPAKLKLVRAWIEIHKDELMADWKLAVKGEPVFRIEPLR